VPTEGEVSFTALEDGTKEDFDLMCKVYADATTGPKLAKRSLDLLLGLKGEEYKLTAKIDMFEHSIQTATRAYRDGADEETVVCCLLHDIGELMSPSNHGEVAAGLLRPYISPANAWTLANHEVFQGFYYYHHVGGDRNAREVFKEHECYQRTIDFCHKWDQPSFDPAYKSESLDLFVPMVERVFARRPFFWDLSHPKACAVVAGGTR